MSDPPRKDPPGAGAVPRTRLTDQVEETLRHRILAREIPPGAKLPPERRLAEELGVNRSSVREAIRRLESQHLVRSRQGDGTRVLDLFERGSLELLPALLLAGGELDCPLLADVLELRHEVGRMIARLAARRHDAEDRLALSAALSQLAAGIDDPLARPALDLGLFAALARAAKNLVLRLLVNVLTEPYTSQAGLFAGLTGEPTALLQAAQALVDAVLAGDEPRAEQAADAYLALGRDGLEQALDLPRRA